MADPSWDMAKDMAKHPHSWHGLSHNNSLSQAPCTPYHAMPRHATKAVMVCKDLQSSLRSQFLSQFLSFSVPNTWSGCFNRNTPGSDSRGVSPHVSGSMIKSAPILPSIIWKNLKSSKSLNYTRCDMHNTRDLHLTKWNTVQYSTIQYNTVWKLTHWRQANMRQEHGSVGQCPLRHHLRLPAGEDAIQPRLTQLDAGRCWARCWKAVVNVHKCSQHISMWHPDIPGIPGIPSCRIKIPLNHS